MPLDRPIATLLMACMKDPRPPATPMVDLDSVAGDRSPLDRAIRGLAAAANFIIANDNARSLAAWERRQQQVAAWVVEIRAGDPPETLEDLCAAANAGESTAERIVASANGTPRWRAILADSERMWAAAAGRARSSSEKHEAVLRALNQAGLIRRRMRTDVDSINAQAHEEIATFGGDEVRIAAAVLVARTQVIGASKRACEDICGQIQTLIDLDENDADMDAAQFLAAHGLGIEHPV